MEEEDFKTRLKSAKNKAKSKYSENKEPSTSGMGHAFKMSTELVAAVAVGTIIGFILDNWFGTKPWLILIFFFEEFLIRSNCSYIVLSELITQTTLTDSLSYQSEKVFKLFSLGK